MRARLILPLVAGLGLSAGCGLLPTSGPGPDECCYNPPPPAWLNPDWMWDEALPLARSAPVKMAYELDFVTVHPHGDAPAKVERTAPSGTVVWSIPLPDDHRAGRTFASANGVFVVSWTTATSGGTVQFLDGKTGEVRWAHPLQALGPQSHSEYRNEIQGEVIDGHLIVRGDEAHGRYVEAWNERGDRRAHRLRHGVMSLPPPPGGEAPPRAMIAGTLVEESDAEHQWLIDVPGRGQITLECAGARYWKAGQRVQVEAELKGPNAAINCTPR